MNEPIFATVAEYAVHRGVSARMVNKYKTAGRLVLHEDGRIVVHASDAALAKLLHPTKGGDRRKTAKPPREGDSLPRAAATGVKIDLAAEVAREKRAKATLAELELAEKCRALVSRAEVESLVRSLAITTREALLAMPGRLAPELALIGDVEELERKLTGELLLVCRTMQERLDDAAVLRDEGGQVSLSPDAGATKRDPITGSDCADVEVDS